MHTSSGIQTHSPIGYSKIKPVLDCMVTVIGNLYEYFLMLWDYLTHLNHHT